MCPPPPSSYNRLEMLLLHSDAEHFSLRQGQLLFQRLLRLVSRGVKLKIVSSLPNSAELKTLAEHGEWPSFMKARRSGEPWRGPAWQKYAYLTGCRRSLAHVRSTCNRNLKVKLTCQTASAARLGMFSSSLPQTLLFSVRIQMQRFISLT